MKAVVLVGNPNVGKSVLFYQLTGNYATVSNYPGTTVEVSQGLASMEGKQVRVCDSPGIYSLLPLTEEEAITKKLLFEKRPAVVVHVVDAKNLPRMLPLTLELQACGFQIILVLNMLDEAKRLGVRIKRGELASRLGIPVVEATFVHGWGVDVLRRQIAEQLNSILTVRPLCLSATMPEQEQREFIAFALERRRAAEKILEGIYSCGDLRRETWLDRLTLHPVVGLLFSMVVVFAGFFAGLFRSYGRLASAGGFFLATVAISLYVGGRESVAFESAVSAAAVSLFLFAPLLPLRTQMLDSFLPQGAEDEAKKSES